MWVMPNLPAKLMVFIYFWLNKFLRESSVCENPYWFPYQYWKDFTITKFYNSDDVKVITGELRLSKTRPTSFYKKRKLLKETMLTDVNKVMKTKC